MADGLASDFPAAAEADWRRLVDKTLGDAPFESLSKATVEGLPIAPLYAPARSLPRPRASRPPTAPGKSPRSPPIPTRPAPTPRSWPTCAAALRPA